MTDIHQQKILILDFGSQYTQLIARRVRECGVYCEIHPYTMAAHQISAFNPNGVILSGGPQTVTQATTPRAPESVFTLGVPVLGICYGMQTMALQLGGQVAASTKREYGHAAIQLLEQSPLLACLAEEGVCETGFNVWMSHGDKVTGLPEGFITLASSENAPIAAMACLERHFYGLQFHPEVTHTIQGTDIIKQFVLEICGIEPLWTTANIAQSAIEELRQHVGNERVLLALSGGVDSSVVAALLHKAIGDQLVCVFVDTGLLRYQEADDVLSMFGQHMGINIVHVNASDIFLNALVGVNDPEEKRKIIGRTFIEVFEREAHTLKGIKYLAQGTIYPDIIESAQAGGQSHTIKSHHNVGGLPDNLSFELIEPIRELFKDEVRALGMELGLPYEMVYRHPFPGPGLGVRVLGEVRSEFVSLLRKADHIFISELKKQDLYHQVSQAFAVFLPVKSVGVMGDARKYDYVIALRAVETIDFMTARWAHLPHEFLAHVSNRIINEIEGISRVTYDISGKPPATIEWE